MNGLQCCYEVTEYSDCLATGFVLRNSRWYPVELKLITCESDPDLRALETHIKFFFEQGVKRGSNRDGFASLHAAIEARGKGRELDNILILSLF